HGPGDSPGRRGGRALRLRGLVLLVGAVGRADLPHLSEAQLLHPARAARRPLAAAGAGSMNLRRALAAAGLWAGIAAAATEAGWARQGSSDLTARADAAFARDDYAEAVSLYRQALDTGAFDTHTMSRLAMLLTWRGEYPEAIRLYQRAIDADAAAMEP